MNVRDPRDVFGLDRRAVVQAFDRASASYDAAAALQERVRNELMGRLADLKLAPTSILDLGAGTGHASRALKRRYPDAIVVAVDIAPGINRAGCGASSACAPTPIRCRSATAASISSSAA